jgi:hypothetical protein
MSDLMKFQGSSGTFIILLTFKETMSRENECLCRLANVINIVGKDDVAGSGTSGE